MEKTSSCDANNSWTYKNQMGDGAQKGRWATVRTLHIVITETASSLNTKQLYPVPGTNAMCHSKG